jgi:type IV secretion system protein VirD4
MTSEQKHKARLIGWLVIAVLFTLGCVAYALYTYSQAMWQAIGILEPSFQPVFNPEGGFLQNCLFDLRYNCSTTLFSITWQNYNSLFPYSIPLGLMLITFVSRKFKPPPLYTADWATGHDIADMCLVVSEAFRAPIRRALLLAVLNRKLIGIKASDIRLELGHVLICGPTRVGKSQQLICNLINWSGSVVVVDIKGELHSLTSGHRARFSNVVVLDPSGFGQRYDPFADIGNTAEALQTAAEVVLQTEQDKEPVFAQRGANALIAARRAAYLLKKPTLPYLYEVMRWGLWHFIDTLRQIDDEQVSTSLVRFVGRDVRTINENDIVEDRFLNSSWSTVTAKMTPLLTEGVLKMTSGFDFCARQLLEQPTTLYLRFSEAELDSNKHIFRLALLAIITAILRYKDTNPDKETIPLLLGLDEAGRIQIPRLDDLVATAAARDISTLIYVQDLSKFAGTYGRTNANAILANCDTQLFYPPKDLETARYISSSCGAQSRKVQSFSKEPGPFETKRFTYSEAKRELITPDEARQLGRENVILFVGDKPPIKAKRLMWLKHHWIRRNTKLSPTKVLPIAFELSTSTVTEELKQPLVDQEKFFKA